MPNHKCSADCDNNKAYKKRTQTKFVCHILLLYTIEFDCCYNVHMDEIKKRQDELQVKAGEIIKSSRLMELLNQLGNPIACGSSVTGLMVYPDIDLSVQNENPDIQKAINLVPIFFNELKATGVKIVDFKDDPNESAAYYVGIKFPYLGESWNIDATIRSSNSRISNPPEVDDWIKNMTSEQRLAALRLKQELIAAKRYVGSRSQPPYTFRSIHLYEGVFKGGAKSISDLEKYFNNSNALR
jgi:hypothetical protein